jgi:hypothetical protein
MDKEAPDLEHRVEAQGEVIMALLAVVARQNPEAITELRRMFANRHAQRVHVQGYPGTIEHAEAILETSARIHLGLHNVP